MRITFFIPLLAAFGMASVGCGSVQSITSEPVTTRPEIDGSLEDWAGSLTRFEDGRLLLGVRNDGEFLYVAVSTSNQATVREIMMTGMELWVDAEGGKSEQIGFRYPLGIIHFNRGSSNALPLPSGRVDPRTLSDLFAATKDDLEVLVLETLPRRVRSGAIPYLEADARLEFGTLTYEMAIPLAASADLDLGISAASVEVGLGLKTTDLGGPPGGLDPTDGRDGGIGGRGGIGGAGAGRGAGGRAGGGAVGGGGGGRGGTGTGRPDPLNLWLRVALSR